MHDFIDNYTYFQCKNCGLITHKNPLFYHKSSPFRISSKNNQKYKEYFGKPADEISCEMVVMLEALE